MRDNCKEGLSQPQVELYSWDGPRRCFKLKVGARSLYPCINQAVDKAMILNSGTGTSFAPQERLAMSEDIFACRDWRRDATGI